MMTSQSTTVLPPSTGTRGKVLIILSGKDFLTLSNEKKQPTGYFLSELADPLMKLLEAGYEPVFANPDGSWPVQDPMSSYLIWFLGNYKERERERALIESMKVEANFASPRRFADITEVELERFSGVFVPGGHAPMEDLHDDKDLGRILLHFHNRQKPTGKAADTPLYGVSIISIPLTPFTLTPALVCHGPVALLSTRTCGTFPYTGYQVTAYSDAEEKLNEVMFGANLKFKLADELEKAGMKLNNTFPMGSKISVDRELITGQNPSSAGAVGKALVEKLNQAARVA
ncbi:hypothetical protein HK104_002599 [Borealophlyctis nickersoniae]|nr:hypothetical protein HK104_002599 [Borealophlyctis nickersoniae]